LPELGFFKVVRLYRALAASALTDTCGCISLRSQRAPIVTDIQISHVRWIRIHGLTQSMAPFVFRSKDRSSPPDTMNPISAPARISTRRRCNPRCKASEEPRSGECKLRFGAFGLCISNGIKRMIPHRYTVFPLRISLVNRMATRMAGPISPLSSAYRALPARLVR
jgi:hypothetical protein